MAVVEQKLDRDPLSGELWLLESGSGREASWLRSCIARYPVFMSGRAGDWLKQAEADLALARDAARGGHHEWACFAAQQGSEKALKAVHLSLGQEAWGHSVTELLDALGGSTEGLVPELLDKARALDKLYVPTRYPNGLPSGAPTDYFTRAEADRAVSDAEAILEFCRRALSR